LKNLTAIVWLHRGQQSRFLGLVRSYFDEICAEAAAIPAALEAYGQTWQETLSQLAAFADSLGKLERPATALTAVLDELAETEAAYQTDRAALLQGVEAFRKDCATLPPTINLTQHGAGEQFAPLAEGIKGLVKQMDLLHKRMAFAAQKANELANDEQAAEFHDRRALSKRLKQLDEDRKAAEEQLKAAAYFHRQIVWLQDRFPEAELRPVPGLCKVVSRADIEAADWSLTPGRYVGVAPPEVDEDFDFEQAMRDIHVELADLNQEAATLAAKIQENFEGLGI